MKPVFFYGLFMDSDLLKSSGYQPTHARIACLKDYRLLLGERATLIPEICHETWGAIISLNEQELKKLYCAPSVSDYQAIDVVCETLKGDQIEAKVYVLPNDYPLSDPIDANYANQLLDICQKIKLPISHQQMIEDIIIAIEDQ
ncbi:MAG: gamma-glutamylcyclotransferase [Kordiimonadaceae bacterium]|jgi:hypothetical protein|nr:gamma-glutamylcyclotransferase [Kordiimonadaceae bacterium]MBT6031208.1 gamma-glutamylcyclotransferase [Kordiimonadaceae bacterium]